jgi:hypothetical protein
MTEDPKNEVSYEKTDVQDRAQGKNLFHAPQPALTAAVGGSAGGSYNAMAENLINNNTQRLLDIETALKKLGLIK